MPVVTQVIWNGEQVKTELEALVKDALIQIGQDLRTTSISQCPISDIKGHAGTLRRSCKVLIENEGDSAMTLTVGYWGEEVPYARIQHETPWFNHPNGGKWKYLEEPFNTNLPRYQALLQSIPSKLKKRGGQ